MRKPITRESERAANAGILAALTPDERATVAAQRAVNEAFDAAQDRPPTPAEALTCILDLAGEALRDPTDRQAQSFALVATIRDNRAAEDIAAENREPCYAVRYEWPHDGRTFETLHWTLADARDEASDLRDPLAARPIDLRNIRTGEGFGW